jgi:hypothetical protein
MRSTPPLRIVPAARWSAEAVHRLAELGDGLADPPVSMPRTTVQALPEICQKLRYT